MHVNVHVKGRVLLTSCIAANQEKYAIGNRKSDVHHMHVNVHVRGRVYKLGHFGAKKRLILGLNVRFLAPNGVFVCFWVAQMRPIRAQMGPKQAQTVHIWAQMGPKQAQSGLKWANGTGLKNSKFETNSKQGNSKIQNGLNGSFSSLLLRLSRHSRSGLFALSRR